MSHFIENFTTWDFVGYAGNAIFASRFLLQWIVSEIRKESVIPTAFWWLSLVGSVVLAVYYVGLGNGPGTIGFAPNAIIYLRNLQLVRRQKLAQRNAPGVNP